MAKSRKALDWLSTAHEDLEVAEENFERERHPAAVYQAELSAQKTIKALISALGFEPGKTHHPTLVLRALVRGGLVNLNEDAMRAVEEAVSYAMVL